MPDLVRDWGIGGGGLKHPIRKNKSLPRAPCVVSIRLLLSDAL